MNGKYMVYYMLYIIYIYIHSVYIMNNNNNIIVYYIPTESDLGVSENDGYLSPNGHVNMAIFKPMDRRIRFKN